MSGEAHINSSMTYLYEFSVCCPVRPCRVQRDVSKKPTVTVKLSLDAKIMSVHAVGPTMPGVLKSVDPVKK